MKVLKTILFIILALFVIYLIVCFTGSKRIDAKRSAVIDAPTAVISNQINNLNNWENWSPWTQSDPSMEVTYGEKTIGVGGNYSWTSDQGNGRLEIIESSPTAMKTKMNFDGWDGNSFGQWNMDETEEGKTNLTWAMTSDTDAPLLMRGMMTIMGMQKSVEKSFEEGLTSIKSIAEEDNKKIKATTVNTTEIPSKSYIMKRNKIPMNTIPSYYAENFSAILEAMSSNGIPPGGMPTGVYYDWNTEEGVTDIAAAFPVDIMVLELEGFDVVTLEGSNVLIADHYGPHNTVGTTHWAIDQYMTKNGIEYKGPSVESYLNDPSAVKEDQIHTRITYYVN